MSLVLSLLLLLLLLPEYCSRASRKQQGLQFRSSEKRGAKGEGESGKVCSSEKTGAGGGGGRRPPLFANLPKMTLFSSLLPPKAISCGFSILCVGEEAFTHLFVLQRLSFALLCLLAFLLHPEAFSSGFLSVGEDVFIHFFTA